MIGYELPVTLSVGGKEYPIRTDYRAVLSILRGLADPELDNEGKALLVLMVMYPTWQEIPLEHVAEAVATANDFIDCGMVSDGTPQKKVMDWGQDAPMIITAVNSVAKTEVRALPYLHWWTFFGYFLEIGESLLSTVIHIRKRKRSGEKLEKWERDFYSANRGIVDLKNPMSQEEREIIEGIEKWLSG